MPKFIDLTGLKFGRLTVLERADNDINERVQYLCRCWCGEKIIIRGTSIKNGHTKSCGCLNKDIITKHGHAKNNKRSKIYRTWQNIKTRCNNPKDKAYKYYGGKGVTVCDRWLDKKNGFNNFFRDMGLPPTQKHQIDRIDNNKLKNGYSPENCRWILSKENNRNRRNSLYVVYNNNKIPVIELAKKYKIPYDVLYQRIFNYKWSIKRAMATPVQKRGK